MVAGMTDVTVPLVSTPAELVPETTSTEVEGAASAYKLAKLG